MRTWRWRKVDDVEVEVGGDCGRRQQQPSQEGRLDTPQRQLTSQVRLPLGDAGEI